MTLQRQLRMTPLVETIELTGKTITLRQASMEDVAGILQMSREVCGPWDYFPSAIFHVLNHPMARVYVAEHEKRIVSLRVDIVNLDLSIAYCGAVRSLRSYRQNSLLPILGYHSHRALQREFPTLHGTWAATKSPDRLKNQVKKGYCTLIHKWKMTEFELMPQRKNINRANTSGQTLAKEEAVTLLQANASDLFPDNFFMYSYLWTICRPSASSFTEAHNFTNICFHFAAPGRLSGVAFFDVVAVEAGTLGTVFIYTRDSSDSQLVLEMLRAFVSHLQTTAKPDKPVRVTIHFPLQCDGQELTNGLNASGLVQERSLQDICEIAGVNHDMKKPHKL